MEGDEEKVYFDFRIWGLLCTGRGMRIDPESHVQGAQDGNSTNYPAH